MLRRNKWIYKMAHCVSALAILITASNVNAACVFFMHQEKLPYNSKKLRKF